ncbi:CYTH domain-containing protein [bacterium]|nr:CYTH domain-containing protein [bacterium]
MINMEEFEVKILEIDKKEIEERLISLGAERVFEGEIHAFFFDFKDSSIKKAKDLVRLRRVGQRSFLAFKKFVESEEVKVRQELEVEVSDLKTTKLILESLGLVSWLFTRKRRLSYKLNHVHFEFDKYLDHYEFVPLFLEVEAQSLEEIYKYVELLGFKKEDCQPWTILELANYYS